MKYQIKHIILVLLVLGSSFGLKAQEKEQSDSIKYKKAEKVEVLYGTQKYDRFVGNMETVSGEKLRNYPAIMLREALAGQLPGVFIRQNYGTPGEEDFSTYIRGNVGEVIILVDGVERPLSPYDIEQIEDVKVLKDAVSKALYGGRKSNGIILVTTKRGKNIKSEFHMGVTRGVKMPTSLPTFLNSYDFANAYNQAYMNDKGVANPDPKFSPIAIRAYQIDSAGLQYPNVDFYDQFLNKSMDLTRVSTEYYGGNKTTKFYVHGGYQKEGGFEAYGDNKRQIQAFNLQGNLDSKFSEEITLHANFTGYMAKKQYPGNFDIGTLASRYPNAYPIFVQGDSVAGTASFKDNPYGGQAQSGYYRESHMRMQSDLGFDINLGKLLKGLMVKPSLSFDIYHKQNLEKRPTFGVYAFSGFNVEGKPSGITELVKASPVFNQSLGDDDFTQRWGFTNTVSYQRQFGLHEVDVDLVYYLSKYINAGTLQDYKRQNLGLRANYTFNGKYTLEGVVSYSGSTDFSSEKRFKYYPALGAGWLISQEDFLKDNSIVDFLKLNGSWGIMGNGNIGVNLWRESWVNSAGYVFNSASTASTVQMLTVSSDMLDWPTQREVDINMEARLLKSVGMKVSYFDYLESGFLARAIYTTPGIIGAVNYLPQSNFGKTGLKGFELQLSHSGNIGQLKYELVGHMTKSKNTKVKIDELPDPLYSTQGTGWDATWGYLYDGLYTAGDIASIQAGTSTLAVPSYMDPKSLLEGNLKYKDLNNDKVIDKYDTRVIGNNAPRLMYGGDLKLSYKGFDLYAMVLGYGDFKRLLNNQFYQINSTRKYSTVIFDGLPNGNAHPKLTTTSGINDFQTSDYWIVNGAYVKLQNVSLSYTLPKQAVKSIGLSDLKLFLYGTDLLTISRIKNSDPESIDAGVNDYPLFSTYALGVSISF